MSGRSLRIAIAGIEGRMGREIRAIAERDEQIDVVAGIVRAPATAETSGGVPLVTSVAEIPGEVEVNVVIDFSVAASAVSIARGAAALSIPLVVGTTGISEGDLAVLRSISETIPIWYARNMSFGVSVLHDVLRRAAAELSGYDIEIVEMHHRNKVDAPSGTALALAETIQRTLGNGEITTGRSGSGRRAPGEIGVQSLRGGGSAGEHTVIFASDDEEIRFSHRALSRAAFASGAIRAAKRIATAPPGWYSADG
jgi:4-hydroxy-tetrahydrodipicolinate reductase